MAGQVRLIEIAGAPYERGVSYGRQARPEIAIGIGHYTAQAKALGLDEADLKRVTAAFLPRMEAFAPHHVEEMRGIAVGADVPLHEIVLLNARTEVLKLAVNPANRERLLATDEPDGCTGIACEPSATADGQLIHAHNWDWKMESADSSIVVRIRSGDGPDILMFTEAGALGRMGMNSVGTTIAANALDSERDYRRLGVPLALLRRHVLEQRELALSLKSAYATPKSASNNITIGSASGGMVFNLECAPDETFLVAPDRGVVCHANHWQSQAALSKLVDRSPLTMPDSLYRDRRLRALVEPDIGRLTVDHIKAALADDWQSPWSLCRPPRPSMLHNLTATVVTLVMQPSAGLMEIALLPATGGAYVPFTLEMDGAARLHG